MTGMGTGRDVCREGAKVLVLPDDVAPVSEDKERATDGIVRLQSGTNRFDSQRGMTGFGTIFPSKNQKTDIVLKKSFFQERLDVK